MCACRAPCRLRRAKDKESGVSRGIDFKNVANVINFDFPLDADSYIHRVGRSVTGNFVSSTLKSLLDFIVKCLVIAASFFCDFHN